MNKFLMALAAIGLCLARNAAFGQSAAALAGKVTDALKQPVAGAAVTFYSLPDSLPASTALTGPDGLFLLEGLQAGTGFLSCRAAGHAPYTGNAVIVQAGTRDTLPDIMLLQAPSKGLNEVQVTGKKQLVVHKQDRVVVNADALLTAAGGTALDVLARSPGVLVDQNGNITLRGKQGAMIYIDDKPTYLSGSELADYLRSVPSSSVDLIELMTNPPARYDAAGTAGIINIRTKKTAARGFNGALSLALTQGQRTRSSNSLTLNYRNRRIRAFASLGYNLNNSFTDLSLNRAYLQPDHTPDAYFEQTSYFRRHGDMASLRAGADYYYSEKTTFGIQLSGMDRASSQVNDNTSRLLNSARRPDSMIIAQNRDELRHRNGSVNLSYRTLFNKEGHGLTADADYLTYGSNTEQAFHNSSYLPDGTALGSDTLTGRLPGHIDIYSLKADYTLPLPRAWKADAGLKYSQTNTDNTADYTKTANGVTGPDYDKSNHFIYREHISAAYLNLSREAGRLSVQGGLRAEHTQAAGRQLGNPVRPDSAFDRNYTALFPTAYISYKPDSLSVHQIGLHYGRRIERPYYQDLNPFVNPMDKFTYYTGNPFLKPSFVQAIELSHTYRNRLTTTLSYSRSRDDVNETIEIRDGIYYSRPGNIGRKTIMSISVDGTFDPAKWLNVHLYSEFTNIASRSEFYSGLLNTSGNVWVIAADIRLALGKGWDGELNGNYRTRIYDAQFILGSIWSADLAVQKKLSSRIVLKLSASDLFYSQIARGTIGNLSRAQADWTNRSDSRYAVLSFTYRFGTAFNNDRQHDATGADAEKNRVKN